MTWNLWWKFGPWEDRQGPILDELRRVDADVISLQEVWAEATISGAGVGHAEPSTDDDQAAILAEAMGYHVIRSTDDAGRPQRFGNAILSREPMELLEQVFLPDGDGSPTSRTALITLINSAPRPRIYVNTHLGWEYWASAVRQRQLQAVVDAADRQRSAIGGEDLIPIIITGDLNGQPEAQEVRRLTGLEPGYHPELIFIDAWAAVGHGPGHTWTRDNPHAADSSWPRRRLDYVLVSWPRAKPFCSPVSAELIGTDPIPISPSDHYGVVVELDDRLRIDGKATP